MATSQRSSCQDLLFLLLGGRLVQAVFALPPTGPADPMKHRVAHASRTIEKIVFHDSPPGGIGSLPPRTPAILASSGFTLSHVRFPPRERGLLVPHRAPAALRTGRRRPVSADSVLGVARPALRAWLGRLLSLGCLASCRSWNFALAHWADHEVSTSFLRFGEPAVPTKGRLGAQARGGLPAPARGPLAPCLARSVIPPRLCPPAAIATPRPRAG